MENNSFNDFLGGKKDIAQFLIFDYFQRLDRVVWIKDINEKSFLKGLNLHIEKYNKIREFLIILDKFFLKLFLSRRKKNQKTILFEESKYFPIILAARRKFNVGLITQGQKDRLFALSNFMGYIQTNDLDHMVASYLKEKNEKYLYQLMERVEGKLKIAKPDYIVLSYDVFPIQRAIILAAKKMGIITLVIQRSMYDSLTEYTDFQAADYALVWGNYFKEFCVKFQMRRPEDIYVLGYPYLITKYDFFKKRKGACNVCYLGEDFQRYNKELFSIKVNTLNNILKICKKLGMGFIYRPHYAENRGLLKKRLPQISFTKEKESLEQTFKNSDIFVSFNSTTLAEASMRGKIALQSIDYPVAVSNFEELGACDKSFENMNQLENFLEKISKSLELGHLKKEFNNNYIETRYNPNRRFLEIINEIEEKNFNCWQYA